jgi:hypothetical protein
LTVSLQDDARARKVVAARHEEGKLAAARSEEGKGATALGGVGSNASAGRRWPAWGRRRSERAADRGRRGVGGLSEIRRGGFCKISATSVNSGRREYEKCHKFMDVAI